MERKLQNRFVDCKHFFLRFRGPKNFLDQIQGIAAFDVTRIEPEDPPSESHRFVEFLIVGFGPLGGVMPTAFPDRIGPAIAKPEDGLPASMTDDGTPPTPPINFDGDLFFNVSEVESPKSGRVESMLFCGGWETSVF